MEQQVLDFLARRNILARPDLLPHLREQHEPLQLLERALSRLDEMPVFLSKKDLEMLLLPPSGGDDHHEDAGVRRPPTLERPAQTPSTTVPLAPMQALGISAPPSGPPSLGTSRRSIAGPMPEWSTMKRRSREGESEGEEQGEDEEEEEE